MTRQRVRPAALRMHAWMMTLMVAASLGLASCASRSPPVLLHRLPSEPPVSAAVERPAIAATGVWLLMQPVRLPQYLDRDALLVPQGSTGLQPLPTERWAEPLHDAVPRLLLSDLSQLRGRAPTVASPVPAGLKVTQQLRVELQAFEATPDRRGVRLQARWSLADPTGAVPPVLHAFTVTVPSTATDADALVAAHRLALWRLAERIVAGP